MILTPKPGLSVTFCLELTLLLAMGFSLIAPSMGAQDSPKTSAAQSSGAQPVPPANGAVLPRGKKLMLTDGSFELVREYKIEGDRVKYYNLDSSQWEQMPASMVDWDATKKVEADEAARDAALVAKVHKQDTARAATPLDIDASLEVAPGIFLPPGDHLFVYDGKTVVPLPQADTDSKLSKGHYIAQVMVPIPIIPTRHVISIPGAHAKLRVGARRLEFYVRVSDGRKPDLVLIRTKVHGESRHLENLDQMFDQSVEVRDAVPMQTWDVAGGVFRFTLGQELTPGEYAVAEMIQDHGASLYVWDFGVDGSAGAGATAPTAK
jgi:hypothetical protein